MAQRRVAIYCRVSTVEQSCDRQRRDLIEYAARADYQVVDIFEEQASGMKCDRPERQKVMSLVQAREIDVVLCSELTRWGRSTKDVVLTVEMMCSRGVSLVCQKGFDIDLATAHGKLLLSMLAALAEFERDLTNERVRSGLAAARARGQKLGRPRGRSRQTTGKLPTVLSLRDQGLSVRAIANEVKLSPSTVQRLVGKSAPAPSC